MLDLASTLPITGKRGVITGGSGYLGRAFMRWSLDNDIDVEWTIFSRDEYKQDLCRRQYPEARYVLGDIRDTDALHRVFTGHDFVINAAAMKYVPEAELNPRECIDINVNGSLSVIQAAVHADVEKVVGISTDKAVHPVNIYGASKMAMERLFAEEGALRDTKFTLTRYGNVVGSTGSVIQLFRRQLREQGFITVTDPNMTRFWMSYEDAILAVMEALGDHIGGGEMVVPIPLASSIGDLALLMAGSPDMIREIGIRPGEKRDEEIIGYEESTRIEYSADFTYGSPSPSSYCLVRKPGSMAVVDATPHSISSESVPLVNMDMLAMWIEESEGI